MKITFSPLTGSSPSSIGQTLRFYYRSRPSVALLAFAVMAYLFTASTFYEIGFLLSLGPGVALVASAVNLIDHTIRAYQEGRRLISAILMAASIGALGMVFYALLMMTVMWVMRPW